jgi:hypothetical protein
MGDDGNIIIFNYQQNKESKMIFHDEILGKEILLKEQVINRVHPVYHFPGKRLKKR